MKNLCKAFVFIFSKTIRIHFVGLFTIALLSQCGYSNRGVVSEYEFSTLLGPEPGYANGDIAAAKMRSPEGIAVDHLGNVYVTEYRNNVVRKISKDGTTTTLAGAEDSVGHVDGPGSQALFNRPHGLEVGPDLSVYVCDMHNSVVRKIDREGFVTTVAGIPGQPGSTDGSGEKAQFNKPEDIAIDDDGNLYVADSYNFTIRKIDTRGIVSTLAGKAGHAGYQDGMATDARFNKPLGLALDQQGNLFVADADYDGSASGNCLIRKILKEGEVTTVAGTAAAQGHQDGDGKSALFHRPVGIAVDLSENIFIADTEADLIRQITSDGTVYTLGGQYLVEGYADGIGTEALFFDPQAIVVDSTGTLYIADTFNNAIRIGKKK